RVDLEVFGGLVLTLGQIDQLSFVGGADFFKSDMRHHRGCAWPVNRGSALMPPARVGRMADCTPIKGIGNGDAPVTGDGMGVRGGFVLAMLLFAAGTAAAVDVKASLDASDVGTIWFASAGTLNRPDPETAYQRGAPVTLSGELELPEGAGPFPAV